MLRRLVPVLPLQGRNGMSEEKMTSASKISTRMIYEAISQLRAELDLIDDVIEQVEALTEDPPRRLRRRRRTVAA